MRLRLTGFVFAAVLTGGGAAGLAQTAAETLPRPAQARSGYAFLNLPIDCKVGQTCWVFNYFDHDPGPEFKDHTCGPRGYNGHDGTDFAVRDEAAMRAGVAVKAAADGRVLNVRDGMADKLYRDEDAASIKGRDCGNGVMIEHGNGWRTQYCHLRQGSVVVKPGQQVGAGTVLGQVGMSGRAAFPHLHLAVRHASKVLDPFLDPTAAPACGATPAKQSLWLPDVAKALAYSPLDLIAAGGADELPDMAAIIRGDRPTPDPASPTAPALGAWVVLAGVRPGDQLSLRLLDPSGKELAKRDETLERTRARDARFVGIKRRADSWPTGIYRAVVSVRRGGAVPLERKADVSFAVR